MAIDSRLRMRNNMGVSIQYDYLVCIDWYDEVLLCGYLDRTKTRVKSMGASFGISTITFGYSHQVRTAKRSYRSVYKPVIMGHDRFTYGTTMSDRIGEDYLLTTREDLYADFFNFCMNKYHYPLLQEWSEYLYATLSDNNFVAEKVPQIMEAVEGVRTVPIHEKQVLLKDLVVVSVEKLTEVALGEAITRGLQSRAIEIPGATSAQPQLEFDSFDSYIQTYGSSIVANLDEQLKPLSPLKGVVDSALLKSKRMYPQQAACVNGIIALKEAGERYGLMAEGMGCGKTVQGAAVADAYFNNKWLKAHPGKGLKDLYTDDTVAYRNIMMAPSHLVEKWKEEILSEIPHSHVEIVRDFSDLTKIRAKGKKRTGRDWYLLSKDFCKLGSQYSPIPRHYGKGKLKAKYCKECLDERLAYVPMGKDGKCPDCSGRESFLKELDLGYARGLVCPDCGEILYEASKKCLNEEGSAYDYAFTAKDFASRRQSNNTCNLCNAQLWGVDVKPVDNGGEFSNWVQNRKPAWYKVSHYKNRAKKGRTSAFVLRGHEEDYRKEVYTEGWEVSKREYGPRKTAPSLFIKKYLKGYFDFCILDECHKYESGGSAQTNAASALIGASDFTIGMTGTLMNGKADSLFYLMWLLDPRKMQKAGYTYNAVSDFVKKYGAVETLYECDRSGSDDNGVYNASSRGRQLRSPRIKPGISPLIVTDFLLEHSVFLDLSDLSKYLPSLNEKVILVDMDPEQEAAYNMSLGILKNSVRREGQAAMTNVLQFGLSYLDKPYGRKPIMSVKHDDEVVLNPPSLEEYKDALLPKEQKLVELINQEIKEDRNCFVYATFTGAEETDVTQRLKAVIEKECNLKNRVYVLQASSPAATEREAFIKKKAEEGIRVFITNPKCVETGLDFCFWKNGKFYNYPTLIFYQVSYELSVMWQASRRGYRLCQTEECRNYYLGYSGTMQAAALQIMGEKQVAASAVQGKFSAEGLAAMANGVDPRVKLAQMLSEGDTSDRKTLENMFDALNASNNAEEDESAYGEWKARLYFEVMGKEDVSVAIPTETDTMSIFDLFMEEAESEESAVVDSVATEVPTPVVFKEEAASIFDLFLDNAEEEAGAEDVFSLFVAPKTAEKPKRKSKYAEGQTSLFDLFSAS